jgi:hypothetical protein
MAMGRRKAESQGQMFIAISDLPATAGHPFYEIRNQALRAMDFDRSVRFCIACSATHAQDNMHRSAARRTTFVSKRLGHYKRLGRYRLPHGSPVTPA